MEPLPPEWKVNALSMGFLGQQLRSTEVENTPCDKEVLGSFPAGCWAFFLISQQCVLKGELYKAHLVGVLWRQLSESFARRCRFKRTFFLPPAAVCHRRRHRPDRLRAALHQPQLRRHSNQQPRRRDPLGRCRLPLLRAPPGENFVLNPVQSNFEFVEAAKLWSLTFSHFALVKKVAQLTFSSTNNFFCQKLATFVLNVWQHFGP